MKKKILMMFLLVGMFCLPKIDAREYFVEMTETDKQSIEYIVTTLASHSSLSLMFYQDQLKKAGGNIRHIHPMRVLAYIYHDPKLKAALPKIGSMAWGRFTSDMAASIEKEVQIHNIRDEYVQDFASQAGVTEESIEPFIQNRAWVPLMNAMRKQVAQQ